MNRKINRSVNLLGLLSGITLLMITCIVGCQKSEIQNSVRSSQPAVKLRSAASSITSTSLGNGVNLQPSYYCSGDENLGWPLMNQYSKITTVRIELDPSTSSTISDFTRWISEAIANGKKVIATFHEYGGSDSLADIMTAANWWKANYAALSANGAFTINLINEWGDHNLTTQQYADAYNQAISVVRQVYSGPIVCDIPGWGQEFHKAADASPLIIDQNIIFSAHVYTSAYDSQTGTPTNANLDYLAASGRPCIVGEFGSGGNGSADWSGLVDHAKTLGWPIIGWAWNGDGTKRNPMNMISPFWGARNACGTTTFTTSSYFNTIYNKL
jgi:hypothetical protein